MNLTAVLTTFFVVAAGELPDKTMFASLILASRGRPFAVWLGAAAAFTVHVVIAVAVGVAIFSLLPHRVVDIVVAVLFAAGAFYSWHIRNAEDEEARVGTISSPLRTVGTAAVVIFVAEWGDLTQILTANLAARFHSTFSVGLAALAALWTVAAVAVIGGSTLVRLVSVRKLRIITAAVLVVLAIVNVVTAVRA
jgi:Ca2+/H+ antiporter, TMEM165/GDT1 family